MSIVTQAFLVAEAAGSRDEVCGLLLGDDDRVTRLLACRNVAATPATRFEIDPAALIAAHRASRAGGPRVVGHYHSHPGGIARPSPTDAAEADADGAIWVIVAGDTVTAWRAVATGALHDRFDPVTITLEPACADPGGS